VSEADELAIEREMLPMIVMWMSPGNETGTGDAFTVPRWIGELRLVPTNINRVLVIINKNVDIKLMFFLMAIVLSRCSTYGFWLPLWYFQTLPTYSRRV
jgi:hypothetical protein